MGGTEKRQPLGTQKAAILADMGIQVWYERVAAPQVDDEPEAPVAPLAPEAATTPPASIETAATKTAPVKTLATESSRAAEPTPAPVQQASAAEPQQIIEFSWLKGSHALAVCPLAVDTTGIQLLQDVLAYTSWLTREADSKVETPVLAKGEFRWPQLIDTGGTPLRTLAAFYDKHFGTRPAQWLLTAEVVPMLKPWLEQLAVRVPVEVIALPALQTSVGDPACKKQIWQTLAQTR